METLAGRKLREKFIFVHIYGVNSGSRNVYKPLNFIFRPWKQLVEKKNFKLFLKIFLFCFFAFDSSLQRCRIGDGTNLKGVFRLR